MTEPALIFVVDGEDRIIEVATQEWTENPDPGPGIISSWLAVEPVEIMVTDPSGAGGQWRLIFELPNGCFDVDINTPEPGDSLFIEPMPGGGPMRPCTRPPIREPVVEEVP
jgi:hypothetical protein